MYYSIKTDTSRLALFITGIMLGASLCALLYTKVSIIFNFIHKLLLCKSTSLPPPHSDQSLPLLATTVEPIIDVDRAFK